MYSEIESYQDDWSWHVADEEVLRLAEETTELGIAVEDAFKNAASAFYTSGMEAAHVVEGGGAIADAPILAQIVALLGHPALSGEHFRRIGELQQVATAFAQIGKHSRELAGDALALRGAVETELARIAADVYELLRMLVRQAYIVIRGSVIATGARDGTTARHVLDAVADLERIFLDFRTAVQRAIALRPSDTVMLQRVLLAGGRMREIGVHGRSICRVVAQAQAIRSHSTRN